MGLVRSWLSGTARALGVSVLVPVVLVGVLLGATVGGVGGLRSLRQLVAGPAIPDDSQARVEHGSKPRPTTTLPAIPPGPTVPLATRERQSQLGHTRTGSKRRVSQTPGSHRRKSPQTGVSPNPAGGGDQQQPSGSPTPRQHPLGAVRAVGERVRRAVEPLPAPVGPTASDAIETVLDIVDPPNQKAGRVLGGHGG